MPEQHDPTLAADYLARLEAYWRAANYLSVGQIYLLDNPLLREPLAIEHVKPRLLGHWGTTPGLNFIYAHLNRVINKYDLDMIYVAGPGHGGPALVANTYLEGTYSEYYPNVSEDVHGLRRLFKISVRAARASPRPRRRLPCWKAFRRRRRCVSCPAPRPKRSWCAARPTGRNRAATATPARA